MRTERINILGVEFDSLTMAEAAERGMSLMRARSGAYAVTPNPEIVIMCGEDAGLASAVSRADMVLADGVGVIYAAKILKKPIAEKVPGIDFAAELFSRMAAEGMSVFLYGAKPGVAECAGDKLKSAYPGLVIAGCHDGYDKDSEKISAEINEASPDFLMVCLGSPKQELWMCENAGKISAGLMAGLGGSLDVLAGEVKRAPPGWRKLGLEWLYRLIQEPKRLKRMLKLPRFLFAAVWLRVKGEN